MDNNRYFCAWAFVVVLATSGCKEILTGPSDSPIQDIQSAPITRIELTPREQTIRVGEEGTFELKAFSEDERVEQFGFSLRISKGDDVAEFRRHRQGGFIDVRGLKPGEAELEVEAANQFTETARIIVVARE